MGCNTSTSNSSSHNRNQRNLSYISRTVASDTLKAKFVNEDSDLDSHERYLLKVRKYRKLFNESDKDGNNTLSITELKAMLSKNIGNQESSELLKWLNTFDSDSSGDITWNEFLNAIDKLEKINQKKKIKSINKKL